jgi:nitrite reductase/ring-hydroxylating ferredoxin subunit
MKDIYGEEIPQQDIHIRLYDEQIQALNSICAHERIGMSEAIRRATLSYAKKLALTRKEVAI